MENKLVDASAELKSNDKDTGKVVIVAGNDLQRFDCQRDMLSQKSDYFAAMFNGNMLETSASEVTLFEVSGDMLRLLLDYCTTGVLEINKDNMGEVLDAATFLQFRGAIEESTKFMEGIMNTSNCFEIVKLAEEHGCKKLMRTVEEYIDDNFMKVSRGSGFLELELEPLMKLLDRTQLAVDSEMNVFHSVQEWIKFDEINRMKHTTELMKLVRLPFCPSWFLEQHVESWPRCKKALTWHLESDKQLVQRVQRKNKGFLAVFGNPSDPYIRIYIYGPHSDSWTSLGEINNPTFRHLMNIVIINDIMYIVCAMENNIEGIDLKTKQRTHFQSLDTRNRRLFSVIVFGGFIYIVGGYTCEQVFLNTVERYDIDTGDTINVAPMTFERSVAGLAVLDGFLYAVGGTNKNCAMESTERYDPFIDKWTCMANLNHKRCNMAIAAGNGYIYVLSGNFRMKEQGVFERYDSRMNSWTVICHAQWMSWGTQYQISFIGDTLMAMYVDGAEYDPLFVVFRYNEEDNTWAKGRENVLPHRRPIIEPIQKVISEL